KGAALKQVDPEIRLQLGDLTADGGLLNAVRDIAHRLGNASVTSDIIEQFEVMNVHFEGWRAVARAVIMRGRRRPWQELGLTGCQTAEPARYIDSAGAFV